jgi:hypothetical protein
LAKSPLKQGGPPMKVFEMKNELEKVAKVIPELREELDEVYVSPTGKKTRIKLLWKQYESKHKELRESKEYKNLNLH